MSDAKTFRLIGKIKGLAQQSQHTRKLISKAKLPQKVWSLCDIKRGLGTDARHHLLAYGLLRSIPYYKIEAKCRIDNKAHAKAILTILLSHTNPYSINYSPGWTIEKIEAWLAEPGPLPLVVQRPRTKRSPEELAALRLQFQKKAG